ncbi:MAG: T9SS C-terminal target domain-containing protein [Flavobacteriales bacterium]|nr:T9SS C-terminal target domain-containing protein [Flavobacteriales bacterium]
MVLAIMISLSYQGFAQGSFAPQAGELGSTAIPKDSACFRDWAISCSVERGLRQAGVLDSGYANAGVAVYATGPADAPLTVSLGDSGVATLMFSAPFYDGEGPDFAVFENGFGTGSDAFLELAFVEVSSDGEHFVRFPAFSEIPTTTQKASFENTDATLVHNLAGKYIAHHGVPFDLSELPNTTVLDKQRITHVRIVDVIGSIDAAYATYDSQGGLINDPWPTNFGPGGFDLDAVGIINSSIPIGIHSVGSKEDKTLFSIDLLGRESESVHLLQYDAKGNKYLTTP